MHMALNREYTVITRTTLSKRMSKLIPGQNNKKSNCNIYNIYNIFWNYLY